MDYLDGGDEDDFEYSGEESDQGADADVENHTQGRRSLDALKALRKIIDAEKDKKEYTDWGFKALKQSTKISFQILAKPDDALETYTSCSGTPARRHPQLLGKDHQRYIGLCRWPETTQKGPEKGKPRRSCRDTRKVLRSHQECVDRDQERGVSPINHPQPKLNAPQIASVHQDQPQTRQTLARQERIHPSFARHFRTPPFRLVHILHFSRRRHIRPVPRHPPPRNIRPRDPNVQRDQNWKKLKEIYNKSSEVRSAIPHPRIMGVIKECGGKMWMGESGIFLLYPSQVLTTRTEQWARASTDFFESFRNYDESVLPSASKSSNTLYKSDPQITAMTDLVVHTNEEKCTRRNVSYEANHRDTIMDDPFIASYIGDLLRSLRTSYLIDLIKPYTRLELGFLAKVRTHTLFYSLTPLSQTQPLARRRYAALDKWTGALENLNGAISGKVISGAGDARGEFERMGALMM
ncbi:PCI protein [Rhizoctonia solani]|uniref:PCI protein n=1 Tax=Rhizoctonia solani TaxID=456999 RepID=A0A8H7IE99_9AGAM|nr:PCI protein [Rhizoctonia solani]